jgi:hypothetical protein
MWRGFEDLLHIVNFSEKANDFLRKLGAASDVTADHVVKVPTFFSSCCSLLVPVRASDDRTVPLCMG